MSDTMPCPGCQATLRVPTGAAAIRCPACKTVISIEAEPVEPLPAAIPLPFGAPPASPPPPAAPVAPLRRAEPSVRAVAVHEDEDDADDDRDNRGSSPPRDRSSKRNSLLDFDDDELDDDQLKEKRRLLRLYDECRMARMGTKLFAAAYAVETLAYLLGFLYLIVAAFGVPIVIIAMGGIGLHVIAMIVQAVGNVYCCKGPRGARGQSYFALTTTILSLLSMILSYKYFAAGMLSILAGAGMFEKGNNLFGDMSLWVLSPLAPTLEMISFPVWLTDGSLRGGAWLIAIPGIFDLARHTYTAVLLRGYCEDGKAPDLGWKISRFMTRIYTAFATLLLTRIIACGLILTNIASRDDQGMLIYLSLTYAGAVAAFAVAMVAQAYALIDAIDVIDYKRFALKSGRLDIL
ncbi:MAG: LSD1-type zinc finger protein [Gemmataceae bacterium]